ncbi:Rv1733c family protein [Nocardia pseudobrasiliensis]|uniref:Uncharacterized protein n=1 Tax=Nocardia pseudobrasiliensis TaxID=45979 RepID=A0A370ID66_9NOCA|nr:hypothetical protein [Nocardia pseudobrasiliensis]RDI68061.1 hypothetical protein DFR76_102462 [Nocardia pseudobrasiliensis]
MLTLVMTKYPSIAVRVRRTGPWSRSPLMRPTDRLRGLIWIAAIVVVVCAVPLSWVVGMGRSTAAAAEIRAESAVKTEGGAVITGDPKRVTRATATGTYEQHYEAAVWWAGDGRATVEVGSSARIGDGVAMWLGPDGRPTDPPRHASAAAWQGAGVGLGLLIEIWVAVSALAWLSTWLIGRRHEDEWGRQWRLIGAR